MALWADFFYKLKYPCVCLFACFTSQFVHSVQTSFCPHFMKSNVQTWGKVMERNGLRFENFYS